MKSSLRPYSLSFALTATLIAGSTLAQTSTQQTTIYRCGPDGRDLRGSPCPVEAGASHQLHFDQPSVTDARAARERAQAEAKRAEQMRREREATEARQRLHAMAAAPLRVTPAASEPVHPKPGKAHAAPKTAKTHKAQPAARPASATSR
ncbi:hypothetical protein RQP53_13095 [Paucibacter sp. APW11]|uniref:DUF4124 domain-containing protein n=1 Tax=Roseateles aquae TaxID=3077235 RepID=A0ABU3PCB5_9BURK|nr:hypothetical protein [Paucibacter sp. APW11]MDT9000206.1 hypothetical protein [Paucibacter sp. APW11]